MASSGTVSTTTFTTRSVIDRAFRRAKIPSEAITGEMIQIALENLYLELSHLANLGAPLWCVDKIVLGTYIGQAGVTLPLGTVDVMNANFRLLQNVTGTTTTLAATITTLFSSATQVTTAGFLPATTQTLTLNFQTSSDGITWTTILAVASASYTAGVWAWFDLDGAQAALYQRVQATAGSMNFTTWYMGNQPSSIPMARLNQDDYTALPNLVSPGKPIQYWLNRVIPQPVMQTWPVTDSTNQYGQFVIWRQRYIQDVGTMQQTLDIPQSWYESVTWGLAFRVAQEDPNMSEQVLANIEGRYRSALGEAMDENRDNSPQFYASQIGVYTA